MFISKVNKFRQHIHDLDKYIKQISSFVPLNYLEYIYGDITTKLKLRPFNIDLGIDTVATYIYISCLLT